jgi:predicted adenine nucleotide alpha hydrolase (AANH) superfamily ATPase
LTELFSRAQAAEAAKAAGAAEDPLSPEAPPAFFSLIVPWFYNPNIHPREEHHRRRDAFAFLAARFGDLVEGASLEPDFSPPYEPGVFLEAAAKDPEEPARCLACYSLRLKAAAAAAKRLGLKHFTTTLLYSRRQKHELVAKAGREAALGSGADFYYEDFRAGWQKGIELGKKLELYRQRRCGCVYEGA